MVTYELSDVIDIKDFAYAWRLTDASNKGLSGGLLAQLCPLSPQRSRSVGSQSRAFRHRGPFSLKTEDYHATQEVSLAEETLDDTQRIRQWLASLPVDPCENVYVCWANAEPDVAVVTTWGAFMELWSDLWYPFDVVDVFDEARNWAILFGPEEHAVYAERGGSRQQRGVDNDLAGLGLVHAAASS